MFFDNLKYSMTFESENVATRVPEELQADNYSFNDNGKSYLIHLYPNKKIVVVITGKDHTTIVSNVELVKVNDYTVDINF